MKVLRQDDQALDTWREGVRTRMLMSALLGGRQLCIFEQFCDPGLGAPLHRHAVEEVLEVLAGRAEIRVGPETALVEARGSVLLPAGCWHGFRNAGEGTLHVRATLAAPVFEAQYENGAEAGRRWCPDLQEPGALG